MGQPTAQAVSPSESIGRRGEPGELKHLSSRRKGHQQCAWREPSAGDSASSGERTRTRPVAIVVVTRTVWKGGPERVTAPYGKERRWSSSRAGHEPSCL